MYKQLMICSPKDGLIPTASRAAAARGADIHFAVQPINERAVAQKSIPPHTELISKPAGMMRAGRTTLKHIGLEGFEPNSTEIS